MDADVGIGMGGTREVSERHGLPGVALHQNRTTGPHLTRCCIEEGAVRVEAITSACECEMGLPVADGGVQPQDGAIRNVWEVGADNVHARPGRAQAITDVEAQAGASSEVPSIAPGDSNSTWVDVDGVDDGASAGPCDRDGDGPRASTNIRTPSGTPQRRKPGDAEFDDRFGIRARDEDVTVDPEREAGELPGADEVGDRFCLYTACNKGTITAPRLRGYGLVVVSEQGGAIPSKDVAQQDVSVEAWRPSCDWPGPSERNAPPTKGFVH